MTLNNLEDLLNILRVYRVIDDDDMCYCVWSHGCCAVDWCVYGVGRQAVFTSTFSHRRQTLTVI